MKDAQGHGSNGVGAMIKARREQSRRDFGQYTPQPSVSNVAAIKALFNALKPPAPIHDAMSGQDVVRDLRGGPRMSRDLRDDPITMRGLHR